MSGLCKTKNDIVVEQIKPLFLADSLQSVSDLLCVMHAHLYTVSDYALTRYSMKCVLEAICTHTHVGPLLPYARENHNNTTQSHVYFM